MYQTFCIMMAVGLFFKRHKMIIKEFALSEILSGLQYSAGQEVPALRKRITISAFMHISSFFIILIQKIPSWVQNNFKRTADRVYCIKNICFTKTNSKSFSIISTLFFLRPEMIFEHRGLGKKNGEKTMEMKTSTITGLPTNKSY